MSQKSSQNLTGWNEVDGALRELGEVQRKIQGVGNKYAPKMDAIKAAQNAELEPLQAQQDQIEDQIRSFCEQHKADFAEKRSKKLTFGSISARLTEKFNFPKTKDRLKDLLANLKKIGRADCIVHEEAPDKARIKQLDAGTLAKLGLKLEKADSFTIKPST